MQRSPKGSGTVSCCGRRCKFFDFYHYVFRVPLIGSSESEVEKKEVNEPTRPAVEVERENYQNSTATTTATGRYGRSGDVQVGWMDGWTDGLMDGWMVNVVMA